MKCIIDENVSIIIDIYIIIYIYISLTKCDGTYTRIIRMIHTLVSESYK